MKEAGKGIGEVGEIVTFDSRFSDAEGCGGDFELAELAGKPDVVYRLVPMSPGPRAIGQAAKFLEQFL